MIHQILFNGEFYPCAVWSPQFGNIGICSFDTETTLIREGEVPDFIIGSTFNGEKVYFVTRQHLREFLNIQSSGTIFMANAAFDISVSEKLCGSLCALVESGSVVDVLLLKQLLDIAKVGTGSQFPSLDSLSSDLLGIALPKEEKDPDGHEIRTSFSKFITRDSGEIVVSYDEIPWEYLSYAGIDAITTYLVAQRLLTLVQSVTQMHAVKEDLLLSHDIQLKAAYAFSKISNHGIALDHHQMETSRKIIAEKLNDAGRILKEHGWEPGGVDSSLRIIIGKLADEHNLTLALTDSGKLCVSKNLLAEYKDIPFIRHYLDYSRYSKLLQFLKIKGDRIHPRFCTLVATGRSSSFSPNVQQLPREDLVRSAFAPTKGHVFLGIDYSQIELRVLAQITYGLFGESRMLELLNYGVDLHRYFAGEITGKPAEDVTPDERNKAKACNFGFPGGLGVRSFVEYAKNNYGVTLSNEDAETLRNKWLDTFPEVRMYLEHDDMQLIADSNFIRQNPHPNDIEEERAAWILRGILCGRKQTSSTKRFYTEEEIEWAFSIASLIDFPKKDQFQRLIAKKRGNWALWQHFANSFNNLKFPSGRIRAWLGYTELKNNLFQGIAADGAKEGLYGLVKEGFRVVNFIHDEYLIEIPIDADLVKKEQQAKQILIEAMKRHCPDVAIEVESCWMTKWQKKGTHVLVNGKLQEV